MMDNEDMVELVRIEGLLEEIMFQIQMETILETTIHGIIQESL